MSKEKQKGKINLSLTVDEAKTLWVLCYGTGGNNFICL